MDIFTLTNEDGQLFSPTRQASIFAKYSRSPESARELVKKTDETAADKFQQKWIVDFGHNAIAELATLPVAFEGVSIIASKAIEKWQRPGVCEKSTRMQEFDPDSLLVPEGLDPELRDRALKVIKACFTFYEELLADLPKALAKGNPKATEAQLKRATFDVARHLLPAGCRTNLGICAYPRDIAEMIAELSGSPNPEFREIGAKLKVATEGIGGPLIRHTEPDEWINQFQPQFIGAGRDLSEATGSLVKLVDCHPSEEHFWTTLKERYRMTPRDLNRAMTERPEHHALPDVFREMRLLYDVYMDYGAFRDLQRHRRMEQFVELLTPYYGFVVPNELQEGHEAHYKELLNRFRELPWPEDVRQQVLAQYLLPLAFRVGWHINLDLRQLYYLVELRTKPQGHISYRRVTYRMLACAEKKYPALTQWCRAVKP
jgi:thymidylate synthase ThyX